MAMGKMLSRLGSSMAGLMFAWAMFKKLLPHYVRAYIRRFVKKLMNFVDPYIKIKFQEFSGEGLKRSEAFSAIQSYLSADSANRARRLRANVVKNSQSLVLSMDDQEEVSDDFNGITVWWASYTILRTQAHASYPATDEKRHYVLTFHNRHREIITGSYIDHVLKEGKAISRKNRQRMLYTNNPSDSWRGYRATKWSHVGFEHPATFDTLAMATNKKEELKKELITFSKGKDYYAEIGRAWKRGYLLYGPPGTGKSTMIAAMANLLNYDVYDLELTTVKDNSELRKLLIETKSKSIIVIEDIDCSLNLTGQRKKKEKDHDEEEKDPISRVKKEKEEENKGSKVTLSGLLNFIDGIWSACGGERIIVFTTNYVEKLDPALIRTGRMDKHIELSFCCFEAFKVFAKNYLRIEFHELFAKIEELLEEASMTPADVTEHLILKSDDQNVETSLKNLIEALESNLKEKARKKSKEESKLKAQEEARLKAKEEDKAPEDEKDGATSTKEVKENGVIP